MSFDLISMIILKKFGKCMNVWDLMFKENRNERWSILYKDLRILSDFILKFGKIMYDYEYVFLWFGIWSLRKIGN